MCGKDSKKVHVVRVFKVIQWLNNKEEIDKDIYTRKYKYWKLVVRQNYHPFSLDEITFYKLPCRIDQLESFIIDHDSLKIEHEKNVVPEPI